MQIYDEIRNYLGSQNFALTNISGPDISVLKNQDGARGIFCVIIDNEKTNTQSAERLKQMNASLSGASLPGTYGRNDVLFIIITAQVNRDKSLTQIPGINLWLVDAESKLLLIYESQPDDFYGLRNGIEEAVQNSADSDERARTRIFKKNFPVVTFALIAVNVIVFIVTSAMGDLSESSYALSVGANYSYYVFEKLEVWRLFTCMFLHFGFMHLAGNMVYLGIAGYNLERVLGHVKFLVIYLLSGIGASLFSAGWYYIARQGVVSAGASGAIYGLIGVILFLMIKNKGRLRSSELFFRVGVIILFLFYSNFVTDGVDWVAHLGGLLFGILLSFLFIGGKKREKG